MIRITTLLWVALLVVAGGTVMHVSYQVRRVQQHLNELARSTHQEQDAIRILSAEWDTLNDPHRIDQLSKRYLTLQPTPIQRVVTLEAVPLKPSADQLLKLNAAAQQGSAAKAKGAKKPNVPAVRPPLPGALPGPTMASATQRAKPVPAAAVAHTQPAVDPVGLILAREERHE
jgi:cell division protein FtsL